MESGEEKMKKEYLIKNKDKLIEELLRRFRFINTDRGEFEEDDILIYDNRVKGFFNKFEKKEFVFKIHKRKEKWYICLIKIDNNLTIKEFIEILGVLENNTNED